MQLITIVTLLVLTAIGYSLGRQRAVATVGGLVFDGSLRQQLAQLRTTLTRGQGTHGGHQAR